MKTYFKMVDTTTGKVNRICIYRKPHGDWDASECYDDWSICDSIVSGVFSEAYAIEAVNRKFPNCGRIPRECKFADSTKLKIALFVIFLVVMMILAVCGPVVVLNNP